jgi:hypothetical protein
MTIFDALFYGIPAALMLFGLGIYVGRMTGDKA